MDIKVTWPEDWPAAHATLQTAPWGFYADVDGDLLVWHPQAQKGVYLDQDCYTTGMNCGPFTRVETFDLSVRPDGKQGI